MRKIRFIILARLILCLALVFASCETSEGSFIGTETAADTRSATGSGTQATEPVPQSDGAEIEDAADFVISGKVLSAAVPNATETFSFIDRITVSPNATWQVSTDLQGINVIPTKTVPLNVGDNVFYILVTSDDGNGLSLYTVTVRRKPTYTVSFQTNGGNAVDPVQVEEGALIAPPADPVRLCYEFAGWDADLSAPVTGNTTVTAKWTLAGHTWMTEYTVDVSPTCTKSGSKSYHCSVCNEKDPASVVSIPGGHQWNDGVIVGEATCTHTGQKLYTCSACGLRRTETIEQKEHRWKTEYTIDAAAGHTTAGSKSIRCLDCNAQKPGSSVSIPAEGHTPGDYKVDIPATCVSAGAKSKYCTVCKEMIEGSTVEIPRDPNAHVVDKWITVEPTLLNQTGSRTGTCMICDTAVKENLVFKPTVISSNLDAAARSAYNTENGVNWLNTSDLSTGILIQKDVNAVKAADRHYYPTDKEPLGNDLLVEVSYLWNETVASYLSSTLTFAHVDGYDVFNCGATVGAMIRSGYEYEYLYKKDGNATPAMGGYGWHRLGFRVHQEAGIVADEVKYTYLVSAYVDGTLVLTVDMTDYVVRRNPSGKVTALLYTAEIYEGELLFFDVGKDPFSTFKNSYAALLFEEFFNTPDAYFVICDLRMTCGRNFAQSVEPVADPEEATIELGGKPYPAAIWYKYAD